MQRQVQGVNGKIRLQADRKAGQDVAQYQITQIKQMQSNVKYKQSSRQAKSMPCPFKTPDWKSDVERPRPQEKKQKQTQNSHEKKSNIQKVSRDQKAGRWTGWGHD